jgi:hypothetical protein
MVRRIREMLSLEAESAMLMVNHTALSSEGPIEEICGIKLHARLGGPNLHHPASFGFEHARREGQGFSAAVQNKIVVVANGFFVQLREAGTNRMRFGEIQRGAFDRVDLASGDGVFILRREMIGGEDQLVLQDVSFAGEIKIGMIREVQRSRLVTDGGVMTATCPG